MGEDPEVTVDSDPDAVTVIETSDAPQTAQLVNLQRGEALGRYVVVDKLGQGAMGVVYRAYDPDLDRGVALKLVELKRRGGKKKRAEVRSRLLREAQAIARVQHPNVVQVFDVGTHDEQSVFVAMEFVEGQTLKTWVKQEERTWREITRVFGQAARGLHAAHSADVIHRDFKPDNAMIGGDGRVRVLDFGLARAAGGQSTERVLSESELRELLERRSFSFDESLTADGMILGTPAYMAPEQHLGSSAGAASDQFSFCVALWEALYGERPFGGETHAAIAFSMVQGKLRPVPSGRSVPRWLNRVVLRGLNVRVEKRYPSMAALADELERDPAAKWRRFGMATAGLAVVSSALAVAQSAANPQSDRALCGGAPQRLAGSWNAERRAEIGAAFERSELVFAADSWATASKLLDDYAQAWVEARTNSCRATRVHGDQSEDLLDLRMACLDRRLADFSALADVLETADRDVIVGAIDAARSLDSLEGCANTEVLTARLPPLTEPALVALEGRIEEVLAGVRARIRAGSYRGTAEELRALDDDIEALAYAPTTSDRASLLGDVQLSTGESREARKSYELAFSEALAARDNSDAAWLASRLTFIVGHRLAQLEGGEMWATIGRALARGNDDDGHIEASIASAEASMWMTAGQYEKAIQTGERLTDYWSERDERSQELALALGNLGTAYRERGEFERSQILLVRALALVEGTHGKHHPDVAFAAHRVGMSLTYSNEHEDALPYLKRALAIHRDAQGAANTEVAISLDGIGRVLRHLHRLDEAEARHREAYEIWHRELGDDHPDLAISLMNIGYTQAAAGDRQGALETFQRARAVFEAASGSDHPHAIYSANAIARALIDLDRDKDALAALDGVLELKAAAEVDPTLLAETKSLIAQALYPTDRKKALAFANEARAAYARDAERWKAELDRIDAWLASL